MERAPVRLMLLPGKPHRTELCNEVLAALSAAPLAADGCCSSNRRAFAAELEDFCDFCP